MTVPTLLWGSRVLLETVDPDAARAARRIVGSCLTAVRLAADPLRARSGPQRLAAAGGRPVTVDPLFADLVSAALDAARSTGGLADPTVGNAVLVSHRPRGGDVPAGRQHRHVRALPDCAGGTSTAISPGAAGWTRVERVGRRITVPAGTLLDLTATVKPFLAVAAAAYASRQTGTGVLVEVGGDLAHHGGQPPGGWRLEVGADEELRLRDGWGLSVVHPDGVVDPATGRPVAPLWRRIAVLDHGAVSAKASALAAHVLGEDAPAWLSERGVRARLEREDGAVLRLPGWPAELRAPRAARAKTLATAS